MERYARPAIVIGYDGDVGKGSGRSIERFDLFEHLRGCVDVLEKFGGHQMAAGLTVRRDMVPELRRRLNAAAAAVLGPADLVPETRVDWKWRWATSPSSWPGSWSSWLRSAWATRRRFWPCRKLWW